MQYMAWDQGTRRDPRDNKLKEKLKPQLKYLNFQLSENYVILMQIMLCDAERLEKEHSEEHNKETNSCEQMKEKLKELHIQGMKKVRQKG